MAAQRNKCKMVCELLPVTTTNMETTDINLGK